MDLPIECEYDKIGTRYSVYVCACIHYVMVYCICQIDDSVVLLCAFRNRWLSIWDLPQKNGSVVLPKMWRWSANSCFVDASLAAETAVVLRAGRMLPSSVEVTSEYRMMLGCIRESMFGDATSADHVRDCLREYICRRFCYCGWDGGVGDVSQFVAGLIGCGNGRSAAAVPEDLHVYRFIKIGLRRECKLKYCGAVREILRWVPWLSLPAYRRLQGGRLERYGNMQSALEDQFSCLHGEAHTCGEAGGGRWGCGAVADVSFNLEVMEIPKVLLIRAIGHSLDGQIEMAISTELKLGKVKYDLMAVVYYTNSPRHFVSQLCIMGVWYTYDDLRSNGALRRVGLFDHRYCSGHQYMMWYLRTGAYGGAGVCGSEVHGMHSRYPVRKERVLVSTGMLPHFPAGGFVAVDEE